jgi:hypothetical protein
MLMPDNEPTPDNSPVQGQDTDPLTPAERERLAAYKAAIEAVMSREQSSDHLNLLWSQFTRREIERLLVYRAAVRAGFFTDSIGE